MNIPGFQLGKQVVDGHFCNGYNALNLSNSKTVNIQVFDSSLLCRDSFVKQFRDVTHLLQGNSFGIMIPILSAEISEQSCYVIYDYFPNPQRLPSLPADLSIDQILKLGLQLAQTLDQLHKAGVVHGGIEDSAVFFQPEGKLALRPVMLQRVLPSLWPQTYNGLESKQRLYLAPEAEQKLTPATDFYALGVLLYQMIFDSPVVDEAGCMQMEKQLQSIEQMSFDIAGKNMTPLFGQILSPVEKNRIQNFNQFYTALRLCRVELPSITNIASASSPPLLHTVQDKEFSTRSGMKWLTAAGLLVTAVVGLAILFLSDNGVEDEISVANVSAVQVPVAVSSQSEALNKTTAEESKKLSNVQQKAKEDLYQKALNQVEFNPGAALMSVNVILRETPDHSGALKLKMQIERNIEARSIIDKAERQLSEFKLLKPSGDNAYDSYLTLADKLSFDDDRVQRGFTQIAAAYYKQAEYLYQQGSLDKAKQNLELGLYVKKGYPPLIDLSLRINEKEKEQKLKIAQLKKTKTIDKQHELQLLQESKRQRDQQRRELEQQRLSEELIKQRQQAQAEATARRARQLAQQQQEMKARDMNIKNLLLSANRFLNSGLLTLDAVFSAHMDYEEIRQLDFDNNQVSRLRQDIIDAYSMLASRDNNDAIIEKARQAIERGVQLRERDRKKLEVRSRLIR